MTSHALWRYTVRDVTHLGTKMFCENWRVQQNFASCTSRVRCAQIRYIAALSTLWWQYPSARGNSLDKTALEMCGTLMTLVLHECSSDEIVLIFEWNLGNIASPTVSETLWYCTKWVKLLCGFLSVWIKLCWQWVPRPLWVKFWWHYMQVNLRWSVHVYEWNSGNTTCEWNFIGNAR